MLNVMCVDVFNPTPIQGSDVYGTLHYGPQFTLNLAFFFSALNLLAGGRDGDWLRFTTGQRNGRLGVHPTDILRVSLGVGVLKGLRGLSDATKQQYTRVLISSPPPPFPSTNSYV